MIYLEKEPFTWEERVKLIELSEQNKKIVLGNDRLVGLTIETAKKFVEDHGFYPYIITIKKGEYGLIGAVYIYREIKLFINEGENIVFSAE